ncbi:ABC transporter permease [Streptomyces thinghirensis]|nr:ABC transporter permease [Streptomyces thinghirensis]
MPSAAGNIYGQDGYWSWWSAVLGLGDSSGGSSSTGTVIGTAAAPSSSSGSGCLSWSAAGRRRTTVSSVSRPTTAGGRCGERAGVRGRGAAFPARSAPAALRRRVSAVRDGQAGRGGRLLLAVLVTSFFLFRMIPGDPVKFMTGRRPVSAEQIAVYRREFGLDLPLWQQFTDYCGKALTGDLGTSYQFRAPVVDKIIEALPNTPAAHRHGVRALHRAGRLPRHPLGMAERRARRPSPHRSGTDALPIPSFWLGLLLIIVLSVGVDPIPGLFPDRGHGVRQGGGLRPRRRRRPTTSYSRW